MDKNDPRTGAGNDLSPDWLHWLMPTVAVVPSIVLGLAFRLWERILVWFNIEPVYTVIDNWKELKEGNELFLVYFLAIYVGSLVKRTAALPRAA